MSEPNKAQNRGVAPMQNGQQNHVIKRKLALAIIYPENDHLALNNNHSLP